VELQDVTKIALSDVTYEIIFTLRVSVITITLPLFLTGKYEKNVWKTQGDYLRSSIKSKKGL
jgi:hypothetical protein